MSDGYEIVIAPRPIDPKLGGELSQIIARITHRRTHRPDTSIMEATGCNEEQLVEIVLTFLRKVENYTVTEVNAGKRGTREIAHLPLNIEGIELFFQKIAEGKKVFWTIDRKITPRDLIHCRILLGIVCSAIRTTVLTPTISNL